MNTPIKNRNNNWINIQPKLAKQYCNILNAFIYKDDPLDRWDVAKICNLPITTVSGRITEMCNYMFILKPFSTENNRTKYVLLKFEDALEKCNTLFKESMDMLDELEHSKLELNNSSNRLALKLIDAEIKRINKKLSKISIFLECQKKI